MILKKITIHNYRSIEELSFDINQLNDETYTYGLIGVNEVGKSTILKAMALKDGLKDEKSQALPLAIDFKDKDQPIEIEYFYFLDKEEINECKKHLKVQSPDADLSKINLSEINLIISFNHANPSQQESIVDIKKISEDNEEKTKIEEQLKQLVLQKSHKSIFWKAEDRYLISQPINLDQFATTPDDVSIPLKNCFLLAGINKDNIQGKISSLASDSTEIEELQNNLGEVVTKHIRKVWPKHPIEITFVINSGLIHFHVKDLKVKGRAKTASQRSDGFKQFISFLLTVSAENEKNQLSNSILLLDEPETHLHPQAQEDLLQELIKITKNKNNNIAFFATHSNYMIDKKDLSRNYKIKKPEKTDITEKEQFDKKFSTYASVTYEVFEIDSMDYHNELYDKLREKYSNEIEKDNIGILEFDNGFFVQKYKQKTNYPYKTKQNIVTLPTFVRNAIHYPQNKDDKFSEYLQKSIKLLKSYEN